MVETKMLIARSFVVTSCSARFKSSEHVRMRILLGRKSSLVHHCLLVSKHELELAQLPSDVDVPSR